MTVQEKIKEINLQNALRITNDWLSAVQSEELKYKEPCFKCGEMEAIKKALEKQIPKKPIETEHFDFFNYECPICEGGLYHEQQYCDECGQALKWGEEDD